MNSGELLNYKKTMELQPSTGVLACTFNSMVSTSHAHHMHIMRVFSIIDSFNILSNFGVNSCTVVSQEYKMAGN